MPTHNAAIHAPIKTIVTSGSKMYYSAFKLSQTMCLKIAIAAMLRVKAHNHNHKRSPWDSLRRRKHLSGRKTRPTERLPELKITPLRKSRTAHSDYPVVHHPLMSQVAGGRPHRRRQRHRWIMIGPII